MPIRELTSDEQRALDADYESSMRRHPGQQETPVASGGRKEKEAMAGLSSDSNDSTGQTKSQPPKRKTWADLDQEIGQLEWEWQDWMLKGFVTLIAAEVGVGKSQLALHVARAYMEGLAWPDGSPFTGETGEVLWCETEAAQSLNINRAKCWGVCLGSIISPSLPDDSLDCNFEDIHHRIVIEDAARDPRIKLVVVDSLSGGHIKDENTNQMLQITRWLARLAREIAKPILLVHHFNKVTTKDPSMPPALSRVRGSTTIVQLVRSAWALDKPNPAQPELIRMSVIKSNAAKFPKMLSVTIGDTGMTFSPYHIPDEVVGPGVRALRDVTAFLGRGKQDTAAVKEWFESEDRRYGWRTLERVAKDAGYNLGYSAWGLPAREG